MHVHISTGFLLVSVISVVGIAGSIMLYKNAKASRKLEHEEKMAEIERLKNAPPRPVVVQQSHPGTSYRGEDRSYSGGATTVHQSDNAQHYAPNYGSTQGVPRPVSPGYAPQQPTIINNGGGMNNGFVEGMILGELMTSHHDREVVEVVHDRGVEHSRREEPAYEAPSRDSGFDYSDRDTSPASDNSVSFGGGGGFDIDFGSDDN